MLIAVEGGVPVAVATGAVGVGVGVGVGVDVDVDVDVDAVLVGDVHAETQPSENTNAPASQIRVDECMVIRWCRVYRLRSAAMATAEMSG